MPRATSDAVLPGLPAPAAGRRRVVYLAGSGHTGSTLLALLMNSHPAVASVGEVAVKPRIRHRNEAHRQRCSCGALIGECAFWNRIFQRVNERGFEFGPSTWTNDYRFTHPLLHRAFTRESSHALVRAFRDWSERRLPPYRRRIRRIDRINAAFVDAVLDTARAEVFFDTSKGTTRLARLLASPEFDVRVVTLVRDVRAFAASARRRGWTLREAAGTWRKDQLGIRLVTAALPPDRRLLVRYEDVCADPAAALDRLCEFCGVATTTFPRRLHSREHHVLGNSMRMAGPIEVRLDQRWQTELTEAEQREAVRIAGELHEEFGYR